MRAELLGLIVPPIFESRAYGGRELLKASSERTRCHSISQPPFTLLNQKM